MDSFAAAGDNWLLEWQPHPEAFSERIHALVPQAGDLGGLSPLQHEQRADDHGPRFPDKPLHAH